MQKSNAITAMLQEIRRGDRSSENTLINLVYTDLRNVARGFMSAERSNHTLEPTAIVHEVFLRMCGGKDREHNALAAIDWQSRSHFLGVAARQMRRVLIDHARARRAEKRQSGPIFSLGPQWPLPGRQSFEDLETVNLLLDSLGKMDPEAAQVVELKFFGGLTDREAALVMKASVAQIRIHWVFARSWLGQRLSEAGKS